MSQRMKLFLLILIINGLLVLIYLVWNLIIRRKEKTLSTWMKAAVMLLCPAVGPLFVFLSFWLYKLVMWFLERKRRKPLSGLTRRWREI